MAATTVGEGASGLSEPGGPRVRLFVALALPASVQARLAAWCTRATTNVAGLRLLESDSLHVTLCFLGAQPAAEVPAITAACLRTARCRAARLRVREALWLPRRAPRVLAVALEDRGELLATVQARLATALADGGWYRPERRPFLAHVTVARVRAGVAAARLRRPPELPAPPPVELVGDRITLFRSHLGRGGARYEPLATVVLESA